MDAFKPQVGFTPMVVLPVAGVIILSAMMGSRWLSLSDREQQPYAYPFSATITEKVTQRLEQEMAFYQTRIQQTPTDGLNRASLASVYLKMAKATGDVNWYLMAEQAATQSLASLPFNNPGAEMVLARVAEAQHDFPAAIRLAKQVLRSHPSHEEAQSILVTAYLAMGNLKAANQVANALVNQLPSVQTLTLRALVQSAQGKDQAAIADFQRAIAREEPGEPGSSVYTRTLWGRFYAQRGNLDAARQLYQAALQIVPRSPFTLVQLAALETQAGNYAAAERYYDQVFVSPVSPTVFDHAAFEGLATLKQIQEQEAEAEQYWQKAEASFRQHQSLSAFGHRRELARLLLMRGHAVDQPQALELMQAEVLVRRDAETLDLLAWALMRAHRWPAAQQAIQSALATGTQDVRFLYRAAEIEDHLGHTNRAAQYRQQARTQNPNFSDQARLLAGLSRGE